MPGFCAFCAVLELWSRGFENYISFGINGLTFLWGGIALSGVVSSTSGGGAAGR